MSMGLPNTKFNAGQPIQRLGVASRQYKVAPSIAEKAIFIPKPHDRVDFKLKVGAGRSEVKPMPSLGQGKAAESVQLLGSGDNSSQSTDHPTGENIAAGTLGVNGVTARFDQSAWGGQPGGYVAMEINSDPNKQTGLSDPIPTQEEGRQVNNRQIHFTQQYDSYGRPRIGFSREPYDFAATKYVSVTSQIAFQANMAQMHDEYDKYLLTGNNPTDNSQPSQQATSDTAQQAAPNVTGQDKGAGDPASNVIGAAKAAEMSKPNVMGQETVDAMYKPTVMGHDEAGKGAKEIPIFGSTSDKPSVKTTGNEGGSDPASDKVTAKESFEKQKMESTETSEGDGGSDDGKKSGAGGRVGFAYGSGAGHDAKNGSLSVAI